MFSKPKAPAPPPPPPQVDEQQRTQIERDALKRRKGRRASIHSSQEAPTQTAKTTLLGG